MTLHIYRDLTQGTEEWLDARRGIITASAVGQLITVGSLGAIDYECPTCLAVADFPCVSVAKGKPAEPIKTMHPARAQVAVERADQSPAVLTVADTDAARSLTATIAAERITGFTDPTWINADMQRGIEDEPRARETYSGNYGVVEEVGFMTEDRWGFTIGYSPDGLVGDDGLIECKSRRSKTHVLHVVAGEVPPSVVPQLQTGLLVSGRKWIDYVGFAGGMALWVKRVYPDPAWQEAIVTACRAFEQNCAELIDAYTNATTGLPMTERVLDLGLVF